MVDGRVHHDPAYPTFQRTLQAEVTDLVEYADESFLHKVLCFQFVPGRDDFAIDERPPGYRWLHLYPVGRIDTRVVWVPAE